MAGAGWRSVLLVWGLAAIGIFLTLRYPRRFETALLLLYLVMGWALLALLRTCFALLHGEVLALILGGGIVYTAGAVLQMMPVKFHNPAWHLLILVAALDALRRHQPAAHRQGLLGAKNLGKGPGIVADTAPGPA